MRIAISITALLVLSACSDDGSAALGTVDARDQTPIDASQASPDAAADPAIDGGQPTDGDPTIDAADPTADATPVDAAVTAPPDAAPPDAAPTLYGVSGCWITHTANGDTQLDLVEAANGQVTGTQSFMDLSFPVDNGTIDDSGLTFSVHWVGTGFDFVCDYNFTTVSADAMSGTVTCPSGTQDMTTDRTCP
ncbi:hypothetical protein [Haliangium sp.]|uniref:hypothetical protein n=1 Tax=Haliangium sp. TaxID=2663208 RepID=UPI003D0A060F